MLTNTFAVLAPVSPNASTSVSATTTARSEEIAHRHVPLVLAGPRLVVAVHPVELEDDLVERLPGDTEREDLGVVRGVAQEARRHLVLRVVTLPAPVRDERATGAAVREQVVPHLHVASLHRLTDRLGSGEAERVVQSGDVVHRGVGIESPRLEPTPAPVDVTLEDRGAGVDGTR